MLALSNAVIEKKSEVWMYHVQKWAIINLNTRVWLTGGSSRAPPLFLAHVAFQLFKQARRHILREGFSDYPHGLQPDAVQHSLNSTPFATCREV